MDQQEKINETYSEINRDIAQILFAVFLIQPFVTGVVKPEFVMFGVLGSIGFWAWSIYILKKTYARNHV